jgi:hypothetical protein
MPATTQSRDTRPSLPHPPPGHQAAMAHDGIARTGTSQFTCLRHQGGIRFHVTHRKHPGILDVDPANQYGSRSANLALKTLTCRCTDASRPPPDDRRGPCILARCVDGQSGHRVSATLPGLIFVSGNSVLQTWSKDEKDPDTIRRG